MENPSDERALFKLSPNIGEGETSMSTVVKGHMMNILKPLTQRIADLEERSTEHDSALSASNDDHTSTRNRLDELERKISEVAGDLSRTNEALRDAHDHIQDHGNRHTAAEREQESAKQRVNRVETSLKDAQACMQDLNRARDELDGRIRELQMALSETNIAHLSINDRMTEVRTRHEGLQDRHLDLVKTMQEVKQSDENTRQAIKRFTAAVEKNRKDDQRATSGIEERMKNAEACLMDIQHRLEASSKTSKTAKKDVDQLKVTMDELLMGAGPATAPASPTGAAASPPGGMDKSIQELGESPDFANRRGSARSSILGGDVQTRMLRIEDAVNMLTKQHQQDQGAASLAQSLKDELTRSKADVSKQSMTLDGLTKVVNGHTTRITTAEQHLAEGIARHGQLKESTERSDLEVRATIAQVQRELVNKLDFHAHELAKTNTSLMQEQQRINATTASVQSLSGQIGDTNGQVAKMNESLGLAHEYFSGLTKGLHDTHKRVAATTDGMLPPKGATQKKLPGIATTPRDQGSGTWRLPPA